jgi:hypothetical protein
MTAWPTNYSNELELPAFDQVSKRDMTLRGKFRASRRQRKDRFFNN